MTSKPTQPEQQVTLDGIRVLSQAGCIVLARKAPGQAATAQQVLRFDVLPVVGQLAQTGGATLKTAQVRSLGVDIGSLLADWETWLGPGLAMVKLLAAQQGWLDTDATYWVAVQEVVTGCLAGLDSVLVTP